LLILSLAGCGSESAGNDPTAPEADSSVRNRGDAATGGTDTTLDAGSGECQVNSDCGDENPCTSDFCDGGTCFHTPNNLANPSQIPGNCRMEVCESGLLVLVEDNEDVPADDGFECTEITCVEGELDITVDNAVCDDGNRCNGTEVCDANIGCRAGPPADFDEDGIADGEDPDPPDIDEDSITDCADWETCDGLDNDHNGFVDDNPVDTVLGEDCYDGPEETNEVGQCLPGVRACESGRIVCVGQVLPGTEEYCDGLDNDCDGEIPPSEIDSHCTTSVVFENEPSEEESVMRVEFPTELREVDVHFNIDTTGSMSGALNRLRERLRTEIVPGVAEVIPSAAFGVSTFEDYPISPFGSGSDLPFELWQRVTTRVDLVQQALADISLGSGNDIPESGIESLYQVATGAGTRWPRRGDTGSYDPSTRNGFMGEVDPAGDVDFYQFEGSAGDFVSVDVDASRIGSTIDGYLELYDSTGLLLAFNDDSDSLDPGLNLTLRGSSPFFLKVRGLYGSSRGWYYVQVTVGGTPMLPAENTCSELEVGMDVFAGTGTAIELLPMADAVPRPDPPACFLDCEAEIGTGPGAWIRSHCFAGGTASCGDSVLDEFEECDDGNRVAGDGCSATCSLETEGVPRFAAELRYDPGLGHGARGGAGFRENSLPIIVHATDAASHNPTDYTTADPRIESHGVEDTFHELEKLGARVIGLAARTPSEQPITDPLNPPGIAFRTGANVPPCAFDDSEPRLAGRCQADQCCVGENGSGQAPPAGGGGMCTLSFRIGGDGSGLTDGVIRGIQALARFATYTITPVFHDSPSNPSDGRCFIHSVEVAEVIQPSECIPQLEFADRDEDGFEESILNATPRTRVIYELIVENRDIHDFDGDLDTGEPCGDPGTYTVRMDLLGDDVTLLSSHNLTFTVEE